MKIFISALIYFFIVEVVLYFVKSKTLKKYKTLLIVNVSTYVLSVFSFWFVFHLITNHGVDSSNFSRVFSVVIIIYATKIVIIGIYLLENILNLITQKLYNSKKKFSFNKFALIGAILTICFLLCAVFYGRVNYVTNQIELKYKSLPTEFNGLKIVQISDFHIGTYKDIEDKVDYIVQEVNAQNPDIIVFTGDFINFQAKEIQPFVSKLKKLKAKYGMFSVLGNHDYGYYFSYDDEEKEYEDMLENIKIQEEIGFKVLTDEVYNLKFQKDSIEIIGTEFWGNKPIRQYADSAKVFYKSNPNNFRILLTHGPLFWKEQVKGTRNIELTLAGHTHGGQIEFDLGLFKLRPAVLTFRESKGLYEHEGSFLYVNCGLGSNGLLGRIGAYPEITVFTLHQK
jgi:predicted MPP superfamily phosphohydrolase